MVILNYLFLIFFIVFSFAEVLRLRLGTVSFGAVDVVVVLIIAAWLVLVKKKKKYKLFKPLLIFSLLAGFSLLINLTSYRADQLLNSSMYLVRFILYAGIYFVIVDLGKPINSKLIKYVFLSGVLILTLGFAQLFLYPDLKNLYYLGFDDHMYRLFGTFLDPNFIGIFFVLSFIFVFILKDQILSDKYKYLIWIFLILDFIALVLTFSRSSLLMFVVSVIIYSALVRKWKIAVGIIGLLIIIFTLLSPLFHIENINLFRTASTTARLESSAVALKIFTEKPMGVGFNTYRYARERYGDPDTSKFVPSHAGAGVDNSYVLTLVTAGFMGLAAYLYLLFSIFRLGWRDAGKNKLALVLAVSMGGLFINASFINSLFYGFVMLWIWILAALTENSLRE